MNKPTIAMLLYRDAKKGLHTFTDKYIQAIYLLKNECNHNVIFNYTPSQQDKLTFEEHNASDEQIENFILDNTNLTSPNFAYRLLEINNYVYLETKQRWEKVTETNPVQLELDLNKLLKQDTH